MDTLPLELINRIAFFLNPYEDDTHTQHTRLSACATLSKRWQAAVEYITTFRSLRLRSDELDHLQAIVTGERRKYVTKLSYQVVLPEYKTDINKRGISISGTSESKKDQDDNDKVFARAICDLFSILKAWEDDGVQTPLSFELPIVNAFSPSDSKFTKNTLEYGRYRRSVLGFPYSPPWQLPKLSNIHHLAINGTCGRKLAPPVGPLLLSNFHGRESVLPNVRSIIWEFQDSVDYSTYMQLANREEFARGLDGVRLQDRATARISFHNDNAYDLRIPQNSVISDEYPDHTCFSSSLRIFSQNLTVFEISACINTKLFWPHESEMDAGIPTWPFLRTLKVDFRPVAPNGDWYFTSPEPYEEWHDSDSDNSDVFDENLIVYPETADPRTINPLLVALGKAVQNMAVLEHFGLTCELESDEWKRRFQICYHAPGYVAEYGDEYEDDVRSRRVYYEVGDAWRPDDEIMEGLRGAGREKFGGEVIERFLKDSQASRGSE